MYHVSINLALTDMTQPTSIIVDVFGEHIASFSYKDGIAEAKRRNLDYTSDMGTVRAHVGFMVCCDNVKIGIKPTEYKEIPRTV